jgi:outer membrane protein TolC
MSNFAQASTARLASFFCFVSIAVPAIAQQYPARPTPITLAEAWARAESKSDQLIIAGAREEQARGSALESGSVRRPRLAAYSSYDRTLRSEFEGIAGFAPDSSAPSNEDSAEIPFGSAHTYRAGLTASYTVFSGGRSLAQTRAAANSRRAAELGSVSTRAHVRLEVTEAYYDAMLAERLFRIAEWTLEQAESTYRRMTLVAGVGRAPEFDVVRSKASRDRERPVVIRRQAERDVAMLRLRQLLHVAAAEELTLPADIMAVPAERSEAATMERAAERAASRTAVREAAESVARGEQLVLASEAGRLPSVSLTSTYERVAYPLRGNPTWKDSRANWTLGARVDLPILTGGRQRGSDAVARAELDAARARLRQTQQLAELDTRTSIARLAAAEAAFDATQAGVDEATRAYSIAMLRFREGVSIQLELSDARLLLEQARVDQARAARDVSVERVRASLLTDLPLSNTK